MRRRLAATIAVAVIWAWAAPAGAATWSIVPTPNPGTTNAFGGIVSLSSGSSSTEVWAVGVSASPSYSGCRGRTLAARWNGSAFTEVPTTPTAICATVDGVAGTSTSDVWGVGSINSGRDTHVRHWDGSTWSTVPGATIPLPSSGGRRLRTTGLKGISALSPTSAIAVGKAEYADFSRRTLSERWNGTTWQLLTTPGGAGSSLDAVDLYNATYGWAVGSDGTGKTLAMKWNGSSWTVVPTPNPDVLNALHGVSARATADVWAVGDTTKSTTDGVSSMRTLIQRWNGSSWSVIPSPNVGTGNNTLVAVDARSSSEAWAVGSYDDVTGDIPIRRPLVLRWNGTVWSRVAAPSASSGDSWLTAVVAPAGTTAVWASGVSAAGTLVMRFA